MFSKVVPLTIVLTLVTSQYVHHGSHYALNHQQNQRNGSSTQATPAYNGFTNPQNPNREENSDDTRPRYEFSYVVNDTNTGDQKYHQEARDGDAVRGEYSLAEPDGTIRRVEYSSDYQTGFNAVVTKYAQPRHPIPVLHQASGADSTIRNGGQNAVRQNNFNTAGSTGGGISQSTPSSEYSSSQQSRPQQALISDSTTRTTGFNNAEESTSRSVAQPAFSQQNNFNTEASTTQQAVSQVLRSDGTTQIGDYSAGQFASRNFDQVVSDQQNNFNNAASSNQEAAPQVFGRDGTTQTGFYNTNYHDHFNPLPFAINHAVLPVPAPVYTVVAAPVHHLEDHHGFY